MIKLLQGQGDIQTQIQRDEHLARELQVFPDFGTQTSSRAVASVAASRQRIYLLWSHQAS